MAERAATIGCTDSACEPKSCSLRAQRPGSLYSVSGQIPSHSQFIHLILQLGTGSLERERERGVARSLVLCARIREREANPHYWSSHHQKRGARWLPGECIARGARRASSSNSTNQHIALCEYIALSEYTHGVYSWSILHEPS